MILFGRWNTHRTTLDMSALNAGFYLAWES